MIAPQSRAGGILRLLSPLLAIALLLAAAPRVHAQSALMSAAQSTTSPNEHKNTPHLKLEAVLHSGSGGVDLGWGWTNEPPDVSQYRIERSTHGDNQWVGIAVAPGDATEWNDPQITTTNLVDYRIRAVDDNGNIIDTTDAVSPIKNNILNIFKGGTVTLKDFQDFKFWQTSANTIVLGALTFIPRLIAAMILFAMFWVFYRVIRRIILGSMTRAHVDSSIRDMLGALLRWSILGFALVIACDQIGIQIAALLTGVSIIGLAIGFAAQETLANFIAGVVIFWDKPFKVGDWIIIDDMFGKVLRVSFRSTRMLNLNGETIVLPNTYMLANRVANHSTHPFVRVEIPIGIAYKESIDQARSVLLAMVHGDDRICKDPSPSVVVAACADSSVNLLIWLWIHDESVEKNVYYEYLEKAKKALDAANISIPFPHVQLLLENNHITAAVPRSEAVPARG